ncbi:MAG: thioredoxin family protein [Archangium sp.]|nr:thioredoxin family protein [Archangium sp.]
MSATTLELTEANFEDTLKKNGILFIDFWAGWCRPCLAFAPTYEAAAQKHADIVFAKVDTEKERGLAAAFEIQAIPTLAIFRDGILLGQNSGALPAAALEKVIEQIRGLDMDKVKAEIAAARAKAEGGTAEKPNEVKP